MEYVEYVLWGLSLFFAGSWTFGLLIRLYRTRFLGHKFVSCGGPE